MLEDAAREPLEPARATSSVDTLRAPAGVQLDPSTTRWVKIAGRRLLLGLVLVLLDIRVGGIDVIPDLVGALAIVAGAAATVPLARVVGPARAASRGIAFAMLHVLLVVPDDVPDLLGLSNRANELVGVAQFTVALVGTAVIATILARSHDAIGQHGRRDRWGATRRWALALAIVWTPTATLAAFAGEEPTGLTGAMVGLGSALAVALAVVTIAMLGRALVASLNVDRRVGFGED